MRKTSHSTNISKKPFRICTIEAPCKINLHLHIGERMPDGFHGLQGIFASLAFGDTLRFECGGAGGESLLSVNPNDATPIKDNLVLRAVSLFRERIGFKFGLKIHLDKRIPVGAGLGGGSSDAASTLLALNALSEGLISASLPMDELKKLALSLGSDVPFFLTGGTALVSGRGDLVEPVKSLDGLWVVLAKPPFSSYTSSAYRLLDHYRELKGGGKRENNGIVLSNKELTQALEGKIDRWPFYNDFLPVFLSSSSSEHKEEVNSYAANAAIYMEIIDLLKGLGASFVGLSGAGSCCFGIFDRETEAKKAALKLNCKGNFTRLTFFLAHSAIPVLK